MNLAETMNLARLSRTGQKNAPFACACETTHCFSRNRGEQGKRLVGVTEFSEEAKGIPCEAT